MIVNKGIMVDSLVSPHATVGLPNHVGMVVLEPPSQVFALLAHVCR